VFLFAYVLFIYLQMEKGVLDDYIEEASTGNVPEYYVGPLQEGVAKDKNIKRLEGPLW